MIGWEICFQDSRSKKCKLCYYLFSVLPLENVAEGFKMVDLLCHRYSVYE